MNDEGAPENSGHNNPVMKEHVDALNMKVVELWGLVTWVVNQIRYR